MKNVIYGYKGKRIPGGVIVERIGSIRTEPLPIYSEFLRESPVLDWGLWNRAGSTQLAFAILCDAFDLTTATRLFQLFRNVCIFSLDEDEFKLDIQTLKRIVHELEPFTVAH